MDAVKWVKQSDHYLSDCGMYKLHNNDRKPGGDMYVVRSKRHNYDDRFKDCYCRLERVGTFEECKQFEPEEGR